MRMVTEAAEIASVSVAHTQREKVATVTAPAIAVATTRRSNEIAHKILEN